MLIYIDSDDCHLKINPCSGRGDCVDQVNGFTCSCKAGYAGSDCSIDIDDCHPNPCIHGQCVDGVHSFTCVCKAGYEGVTCGLGKRFSKRKLLNATFHFYKRY